METIPVEIISYADGVTCLKIIKSSGEFNPQFQIDLRPLYHHFEIYLPEILINQPLFKAVVKQEYNLIIECKSDLLSYGSKESFNSVNMSADFLITYLNIHTPSLLKFLHNYLNFLIQEYLPANQSTLKSNQNFWSDF